VLVETECSQTL